MPSKKGTNQNQRPSSESTQAAACGRESELRIFIEHAPVAMAMFDQEMRYLQTSRQWRIDHGLGNRELRGISHDDLFPESPRCCRETHLRALAGEAASCRCDHVDASSGMSHTRNWEARPWHDAAGAVGGILVCSSDATAHRRAELVLWESEASFRGFFEHLRLGAAQIGPKRGFVRVNESFCAMTGYSRRELLGGMGPLDLTHPEDREEARERIDQIVVGDGESYEVERRYVRKNGQVFWVHLSISAILDPDGRFLCSAAVVEDITKRKAAQEELERSQKLLAEAEHLAKVGAGELNLITGEWTHSEEWRSMHGCSKPSLTTEELMRIAHPDDCSAVKKAFQEMLDGTAPYDIEHRIIRQDNGEVRIVQAYGELVKDKSGQPVKALGVARDITEWRKMETALQEQRRLLEAVIEHMPTAVCLIRGSDLRLRLINPAYQAIAPEKDMVGKTVEETRPETGQDFTAICHQVLETGETYEVVDELSMIRRTPEGPLEPAYFSWSLHRISLPGDEGFAILNLAQETTKRWRAEEAVKQSEAFLSSVLNSSLCAVYIYDVERGSHTYVNRQYELMTGYPFEVIRSMSASQFLGLFHPDDQTRVIQHIDQVARSSDGEVLELEYRFRAADGSWKWALSRDAVFTRGTVGAMRQLIGTALDITERKQSEEALRRSEERLRLAQQVTQIGIFDWDVITGRNTWSPEAEALYGLKPEQFIGTQEAWESMIYPEDRAALLALCSRTFQTGESAEAEFRVQWPDGSIHWLISRWQAIHDATGRLVRVTGVNLDITSRKQAELALRESEERFRLFMSNCPTIAWIKDAEGHHVYLSRTYEERFGVRLVDWMGKADAELWPPEIAKTFRRNDRAVLEADRVMEVVEETVNADGSCCYWLNSKFPFHDGAGNRFVGGIGLDITQRKAAEEALREREQEFKKVLETSTIGLVRCSRDLHYRWANTAFARLVGLPLIDIIGKPLVRVIGSDALQTYHPYIEQTLRGKHQELEIEIGYPSGLKFVHVVMTPDEEKTGEIIGWFASVTDISAQKALEREVLRISEDEQQRIGGELHEGICQELIASGFAAKGLQRLLERESHPLALPMAELTSAITKTATHTRQLAHGMNPVVKAGDGLEHALRELAAATRERYHLQCQFECDAPVDIKDPLVSIQLFRIAQEAVHNAANHSKGTRIDLKLRETDFDIRLGVVDNGCGLPTDVDSSLGFGLRSMKYRASLIHGHLTIQNRGGGGTEVECNVPKRRAMAHVKVDDAVGEPPNCQTESSP